VLNNTFSRRFSFGNSRAAARAAFSQPSLESGLHTMHNRQQMDAALPPPPPPSDADLLTRRTVLCRILAEQGRPALDAKLRDLGFSKLGQRMKAINALQKAAAEECESSGSGSPATAPARSSAPRCAFVCHTGYFTGGSFGGATLASLAMLREAGRICGTPDGGGGLDVIALVQTPVPEALVYKLEHGQLGELPWEHDQCVLVGRAPALLTALKHRHYDVVMALSIEQAILAFALELRATAHYATPHNYYLPPFGPFRRFPVRSGHWLCGHA
jgi:hypothetical protein